jgi:hypothetical protein
MPYSCFDNLLVSTRVFSFSHIVASMSFLVPSCPSPLLHIYSPVRSLTLSLSFSICGYGYIWMRWDEFRDTEKKGQRDEVRTAERKRQKSNSCNKKGRIYPRISEQHRSELGLENEIKSNRVNIYHAKYVHDQSVSQGALYFLLSRYYCHCSINDSVSVLSERLHIISHHSIQLLAKGDQLFVTVISMAPQ